MNMSPSKLVVGIILASFIVGIILACKLTPTTYRINQDPTVNITNLNSTKQ